jgi:hypothetical protein
VIVLFTALPLFVESAPRAYRLKAGNAAPTLFQHSSGHPPVFDELVSLFVAAKTKRQVIIVTHNANLVINTDADQVIVADAGPHPTGGLPAITYVAGGLEDGGIRKTVCDILEGGADAFRERARRLRVTLDR